MSTGLPTVNLAGVSVGQSGTVSFQNAGVDANPAFTQKPPRVLLQNESGTGLNITFKLSQDSFTLPAGKHILRVVTPAESGYTWTALYNLPNPPVTSLYTDYYYPNEPDPDTGMLGNSPIGIGGTISVTNVSALSNETTTVKTLIIDIGLVGNTLLYQLFSDGSATWSVISGGVPHTVLQVNNSGTPLQLGKSGDNTEVLGNLNIDGTASSGTFTFNNGASMASGDLALNAHGITSAGLIQSTTFESLNYHDSSGNDGMVITAGATTRIQSAGQVAIQVPGGTTRFSVISTGASVAGTLGVSGDTTFTGNIIFNTGSSLSAVGFGSGSGTGTYTHTLGVTPQWVGLSPHFVGSMTMGYDSETSSNVHVTCGVAATAFVMWCERT
jgi:hypothetical protein